MVDKEALLYVIQHFEWFGIVVDKERELEQVIFTKWRETGKLAAPKD